MPAIAGYTHVDDFDLNGYSTRVMISWLIGVVVNVNDFISWQWENGSKTTSAIMAIVEHEVKLMDHFHISRLQAQSDL